MTKWTKGLSFVALLPVFWSGIADAADPPAQPMTPAAQAAQQHFTEAMNLFQQGEIDHACTLFDQSYREGLAARDSVQSLRLPRKAGALRRGLCPASTSSPRAPKRLITRTKRRRRALGPTR